MKKILLIIIYILLVTPTWSLATDYYAQADAEITTAELWDTNPAGGGTDLTWASLQNGDVLYANNHIISIANDIGSGSVTVTLTTAAGTGTAGGRFTFDVSAVAAKTLYTNLTAGTTTCLVVSGAGSSGTELTINGVKTGGAEGSAMGLSDTHTGAGAILALIGAVNGGTNATGYGISATGSSGAVTNSGNATGVTGKAINFSSAAKTFEQTGDCIGSDTTVGASGCNGAGTMAMKVIGNIKNGASECGVTGNIEWVPTSPSDGVTGHYIQFVGGTDVFVGKNTDDATKALSTFYYIDPTDGTSDQGSATTGGGASAYAY